MKNFVLIIFSFVLLVPVNYAQKKVLPIDLQIGYGLPRKPFLDFGVYLGQSQRHRIGIGADYRIPINQNQKFYATNKPFNPLNFINMGAYDGPGAFIHYEKLFASNFLTLGAKLSYARLISNIYWKGSDLCDQCLQANMGTASFTAGIPIDRRGIFNIFGDVGYTFIQGKRTKGQITSIGYIGSTRESYYTSGLHAQLSLRVKVVGFNTGVAQNR